MTASIPQRRKPPKTDTERAEAIRTCARHLKDLKRAHSGPPADVKVRSTSTPRLISPVPEGSWCTSPAALCAELADETGVRK